MSSVGVFLCFLGNQPKKKCKGKMGILANKISVPKREKKKKKITKIQET
jgi:hypothetical protein